MNRETWIVLGIGLVAIVAGVASIATGDPVFGGILAGVGGLLFLSWFLERRKGPKE